MSSRIVNSAPSSSSGINSSSRNRVPVPAINPQDVDQDVDVDPRLNSNHMNGSQFNSNGNGYKNSLSAVNNHNHNNHNNSSNSVSKSNHPPSSRSESLTPSHSHSHSSSPSNSHSNSHSHTSTTSSSFHHDDAPPFSHYPSIPSTPNNQRSTHPHNPGAMAATPTTQINLVSYRSATIKALIDPSLPVSDVIRQLCANSHLGVQEPPALFALRDEESEELIDDSNLEKKIRGGNSFKLCSSPTIEAVEMVDKLSSRDERVLKLATYTLQRLIRERAFSNEFLRRGGLIELKSLIVTSNIGGVSGGGIGINETWKSNAPMGGNNGISGNTLAYALSSVQNLMEGGTEGWEELGGDFISKIVRLLATLERINVCRPATAILQMLVNSGASVQPQDETSDDAKLSKSSINGVRKVRAYGFDRIWRHISQEPTFLPVLVQRLGSADTTLCLYSLSLINSLMKHSSTTSSAVYEEFNSELERLGVSRAIARLMDSNTNGDDLIKSILEYQNNVLRVYQTKFNTSVTPTERKHVSALSYIWLQARVSDTPSTFGNEDPSNNTNESNEGAANKFKWRKLGFESENVSKEFSKTGWLGLECLESYVKSDPEAYAKLVLEQINRASERRCPIGRASLEVTEILADHWGIDTGYTTSTSFLPFLFFLPKVHNLALKFFLRMWSDSGAALSDFSRVSALVRSQIREALRGESSKTWFDVERDLLESHYRTVRDRQMRELEIEDDFASKASIRNLRGKLYKESFEFLRQQRIACLLEGAWFRNPQHVINSSSSISNHQNSASSNQQSSFAAKSGLSSATGTLRGGKLGSSGLTNSNSNHSFNSPNSNSNPNTKFWRFYRLSPNKRHLCYKDSSERGPIRGGLDDLPEKIDLRLVSDISLHTSVSSAAAAAAAAAVDGSSSNSNLGFSLLRAPDVSLADLIALDPSQYAEWTDGLSMLRAEQQDKEESIGLNPLDPDSNSKPNGAAIVSTRETAEYIQILTDIGVKIKLLDLGGEKIDVPADLPPAPIPISTDFFFAEL